MWLAVEKRYRCIYLQAAMDLVYVADKGEFIKSTDKNYDRQG